MRGARVMGFLGLTGAAACSIITDLGGLSPLPDAATPPVDASTLETTADTSAIDAAVPETGVDAGPCPGKTQCGEGGPTTTCADLTNDPNNCGACGHFCPSKACANSDCQRHVFVSSVKVLGGDIGDPTGAAKVDIRCQSLATGVGLDGSYKAWISDDSSSPSTRFTHSKAPYVRTDGTKIANDWAGLTSGTLLVAINRDESGTVVSNFNSVWSDTDTNGTELSGGSAANCNNWKNPPGSFGAYGDFTSTGSQWTSQSVGSCNATWRFYCFEQ